jgi:flagellar biosynthetic protein FliQ
MTIDFVRELSVGVFKTVLIASGPVLVVSLVVGVGVSLFQAVTQIQEPTLTFIPKILAAFLCLFIFFPWIAQQLVSYTTDLITNIPVYIR